MKTVILILKWEKMNLKVNVLLVLSEISHSKSKPVELKGISIPQPLCNSQIRL